MFPKSQIQRYIIHQIHSSTKYVNYKDTRAVMADLKRVYGAVNEDETANVLAEFKEKCIQLCEKLGGELGYSIYILYFSPL